MQELLRRMSLGALVPLLLHGQAAPTKRPGPSRLTEEWELNVGPPVDGAIYRTAVCPDGSFVWTEWNTNAGSSPVTILRGPGSQMQFDIPPAKAAVTCDSSNRVLVAVARKLILFDSQATGEKVARSEIPLSFSITPERLQTSPSGDIYLLGLGQGATPVLAWLSSSGELRKTTAALADSTGSLSWDLAQDALLVVPEGRFELWRLGKDLTPLSVARPISNFRSKEDSASGAEAVGDRVLRAVWLADGSVAVQTLGQSLQASVLRQEPAFEVIDPSGGLHVIPNGQVPGRLAGASADGSLYFSAITQEGFRVIKMKLE